MMESAGLYRPGVILWLLVLCIIHSTYSAPLHDEETTQLAEYGGVGTGCYYNFQYYEEGGRILTNEPCLNCTCHNRMLMCYLRVCPFTKAIGQDCKVEKRPDQCCPVITCPEVPVHLLTSTTTSPSESDSTQLDFPDNYGCSVNNKFYADGAQLPINPNSPCELCYCIRNTTTCVMQECTLEVVGCKPVYHPGICCPVKYNCDYEESTGTTMASTPGLIMTTTMAPGLFGPPQCYHKGKYYEDGQLIYSNQPCQHCYCFHGDIACAVQDCGTPMKTHGKNCTAVPPPEGECCPTTYECESESNLLDEQEQQTVRVPDDNEIIATQATLSVLEDEKQKEQKPEEVLPGEEKEGQKPEEILPGEQKPEDIFPKEEKQKPEEVFPHEHPGEIIPGEQNPEEIFSEEDKEKQKPEEVFPGADNAIPEVPEGVTLKSTEALTTTETIKTETVPPNSILLETNEVVAKDVPTVTQEHAMTESSITPAISGEQATTEMLMERSTELPESSTTIDEEEMKTTVGEKMITSTEHASSFTDKIPTEKPLSGVPARSEDQIPIEEQEMMKSGQASTLTSMTEEKVTEITPTEAVVSEKETTTTGYIEETGTTEVKVDEHMSTTEAIKEELPKEEGQKTESVPIIEETSESSSATPEKTAAPEETDEETQVQMTQGPIGEDESKQSTEKPLKMITTTEESIQITESMIKEPSIDMEGHIDNLMTEKPEVIISSTEQPSTETPAVSADGAIEGEVQETEKPENQEVEVPEEQPTTPVAKAGVSKDEEKIATSQQPIETEEKTESIPTGSSAEVPEEELPTKGLEVSGEQSSEEVTSPVSSEEEKPASQENVSAESEETGSKEVSMEQYTTAKSVVEDSSSVTIKMESTSGTEEALTEKPVEEKEPLPEAISTESLPEVPTTEAPLISVIENQTEIVTSIPEVTEVKEESMTSEASNSEGNGLDQQKPEEIDVLQATQLPSLEENTTEKEISKESTTVIKFEESSEQFTQTIESTSPEQSIEISTESELGLTDKTPTEASNADKPIQTEIPVVKVDEQITEVSSEQTVGMEEESEKTPPSITSQEEEKEVTIMQEKVTPSTIVMEEEQKTTILSSTTEFGVSVEEEQATEKLEEITQDVESEKEKTNLMTESGISTETSVSTESTEETSEKVIEHGSSEESHMAETQPTEESNNISEAVPESSTLTSEKEMPVPEENPTESFEEPKVTEQTSSGEKEISQTTEKLTTEFIEANKEPIKETEVTSEEKITELPVKPEETKESSTPTAPAEAVSEHGLESTGITEQSPEPGKKEDEEEKSTDKSMVTEENKVEITSEAMEDVTTELPQTEVHELLIHGVETKAPEDSTEKLKPSEVPESPEIVQQTESPAEMTETTEKVLEKTTTEEYLPAGIPGEGSCLVEGQTFMNNSVIPPSNPCQLSCHCISSIAQCELVQCSPPPSLVNCMPVHSGSESCCPIYSCTATPTESLESENQMVEHHTPGYEQGQKQEVKTEVPMTTEILQEQTQNPEDMKAPQTEPPVTITEELSRPSTTTTEEPEPIIVDVGQTQKEPEIPVMISKIPTTTTAEAEKEEVSQVNLQTTLTPSVIIKDSSTPSESEIPSSILTTTSLPTEKVEEEATKDAAPTEASITTGSIDTRINEPEVTSSENAPTMIPEEQATEEPLESSSVIGDVEQATVKVDEQATEPIESSSAMSDIEQPTEKADEQSIEKAEEHVTETAEQPTEQPVESSPAVNDVEQMAEKVTEQSTTEKNEEPSKEETGEQPTEKTEEQSTEQPTELSSAASDVPQMTEKVDEQSTEKDEEQSTEKTEEQVMEKVNEQPTEHPVKSSSATTDVEQLTEKVEEQSTEKVGEQSTEQTIDSSSPVSETEQFTEKVLEEAPLQPTELSLTPVELTTKLSEEAVTEPAVLLSSPETPVILEQTESEIPSSTEVQTTVSVEGEIPKKEEEMVSSEPATPVEDEQLSPTEEIPSVTKSTVTNAEVENEVEKQPEATTLQPESPVETTSLIGDEDKVNVDEETTTEILTISEAESTTAGEEIGSQKPSTESADSLPSEEQTEKLVPSTPMPEQPTESTSDLDKLTPSEETTDSLVLSESPVIPEEGSTPESTITVSSESPFEAVTEEKVIKQPITPVIIKSDDTSELSATEENKPSDEDILQTTISTESQTESTTEAKIPQEPIETSSSSSEQVTGESLSTEEKTEQPLELTTAPISKTPGGIDVGITSTGESVSPLTTEATLENSTDTLYTTDENKKHEEEQITPEVHTAEPESSLESETTSLSSNQTPSEVTKNHSIETTTSVIEKSTEVSSEMKPDETLVPTEEEKQPEVKTTEIPELIKEHSESTISSSETTSEEIVTTTIEQEDKKIESTEDIQESSTISPSTVTPTSTNVNEDNFTTHTIITDEHKGGESTEKHPEKAAETPEYVSSTTEAVEFIKTEAITELVLEEISTQSSEVPSEAPEDLSEAPEVPSEAPEVPSEAPEVPSEAPEVPSEAPEVPSEAPEVPSEASEVSSEIPEVPSEAPEVSSEASEKPSEASEAPEAPSHAPETPSKVPEDTSEAPKSSSEAPEVSSESPEVSSESTLPEEATIVGKPAEDTEKEQIPEKHKIKPETPIDQTLPSLPSSPEEPEEDVQQHQVPESPFKEEHEDESQQPISPVEHDIVQEHVTESEYSSSSTTLAPEYPEQTVTGQDNPHFPVNAGSYLSPDEDYDEDDQAIYGPGTCRYGGKVYVSAQQIPRDDPCDFCFCFRSDIICLQQSCPPPIPGCHEEPIVGFCCPRYECHVSMATSLNITTTTTTTTTTLPPHFLSHAYKGAARRSGCQIKGQAYRVGEVIKSASGPCLNCTCGGDGNMKCDPRVCTPEPMIRRMIAASTAKRRRR